MNSFNISGNIPALVTPFEKNGAFDTAAYKKFIDWQIENGVDAIVTCGSTGEAATLETEEYETVIKTAVDQAKKRVPVIAGASHNNTVKAVALSQIAKKAGADALLHTNPYYNKPTLSGLLAHFKAIAVATDLPILIYNVPGRTGANMSAEATLTIAKAIPQVIGIKEASGNIMQVMDIIKGKSKDFTVLSGDDAITLPLIALGGDGIISVACNEIPKQMSEMVHAALDGNLEKARNLHYEWLDLMNINFIESNPIPVKTALAAMGMIKEVFRLPLTSMAPKNKEALLEVLKKHKLI